MDSRPTLTAQAYTLKELTALSSYQQIPLKIINNKGETCASLEPGQPNPVHAQMALGVIHHRHFLST